MSQEEGENKGGGRYFLEEIGVNVYRAMMGFHIVYGCDGVVRFLLFFSLRIGGLGLDYAAQYNYLVLQLLSLPLFKFLFGLAFIYYFSSLPV